MYLFKRNPDPRQKPPVGSILNPDHWMSQKSKYRLLMNEGGGNTIYRAGSIGQLSLSGGASWESNGIHVDGSTGYIEDSSIPNIVQTSPFSMSFRVQIKSYDTYNTLATTKPNSDRTAAYGWLIMMQGTEGSLFFEASDAGYDNFALGWQLNKTCLITININGSASRDYYLNGQFVVNNTTFMNYIESNETLMFGDYPYYAAGNINAIYYDVTFGNILTDSEILQIYAEPYANILTPQYWYMVDFGAAGQTASLADTLSLSETLSPIAAYKASLSDVLSLSESQSPVGHFISSLSDALSLSESQSPVGHYNRSTSDIMSLTDSITVIAALIGETSDTVTFTDNVSAVLHAIATISDILTLTDSITYPAGQSASLSDTLSFTDSQTAKAHLLATLSDVFTLSDTETALAHLKSVLSDTFNLSDELTTQLIGNLSDALVFSDSMTAMASFLGTLSDALVMSDSTSVKLHLKVSFSDTVSFGEQITGLAAYAATLIDTLSLSDVVNGITITAEGEVTITFSSKAPSITFSSKAPSITFSSKAPSITFS